MSWFAPLPLVRELGPRESAEVLAKDFDIEMPDDGFPLTEPVWALTQREADSVLDTLSPRNALRQECNHYLEEQRIAADLAFAEFKKKGGPLRREIDRARQWELDAGVHQ
jgi:hypothetical protein